MQRAARDLQQLGVQHVVMKGGHKEGIESADYVLLADQTSFWLRTPRIATKNTHGTGDTFSSCIVAELAKGATVKEAIITAKKFIQGAIQEGIFVGHGHGPTNHWAQLSEDVRVEENANDTY
jgi:hydroxymethylpyrimidine/phosphomethylpyrimidine kinase